MEHGTRGTPDDMLLMLTHTVDAHGKKAIHTTTYTTCTQHITDINGQDFGGLHQVPVGSPRGRNLLQHLHCLGEVARVEKADPQAEGHVWQQQPTVLLQFWGGCGAGGPTLGHK